MLTFFTSIKPTASPEADSLHKPLMCNQMVGDLASTYVVAGVDIAMWPVVEISVPAGPLGILLDGSCVNAALLDDFAPIDHKGAPGAVEMSGKVGQGSVLVGMDKVDFMEHPRKSLAEIGTILREAAHLKRQLRFKVPPGQVVQSRPDDDKLKLIGDSTSSCEKENPSVKPAGGWSAVLWKGLQAVSSTETQLTTPQPSLDMTMLVPLALQARGELASFVRVTGMEDHGYDKHPFIPKKTDRIVNVDVPPGPLGLSLDGSVSDRAVVLGFVPLSDGSLGTLERNGKVPCGAEIVEINGEDVSHESLVKIRERLSRLNDESRKICFCLPTAIQTHLPTPVISTESPVLIQPTRRISGVCLKRMSMLETSLPTYTEDLTLRRRLELQLVMSFDRKELKYKECWFAVHNEWMNRWILFVGKEGPEPGPISNHELFVPGFSFGKDQTAISVRPGLEITKDFRCVVPMVWSLFVALHGNGLAPPIARFGLDIYSDAPDNINELFDGLKAQATGLANSLREKCRREVKDGN